MAAAVDDIYIMQIRAELARDDQLKRAVALLEEWGAILRAMPNPIPEAPSESIESRMARSHARRSKEDKRQKSMWRRAARFVEIGEGNMVRMIPMYPQSVHKQTKVTARPVSAPWPQHIEALERVLARQDDDVRRVAEARYVHGCGCDTGPGRARVSYWVYRDRSAKLIEIVANALGEIDAAQ